MATMAIPDTMDIDTMDMADTTDTVMATDTGAARSARLTPPSSPHPLPSLPLRQLTSPLFTLMPMALELLCFTLLFPTPTLLDPLQLNILPALLRSKLMLLLYMQATTDTPMEDGVMAMEFPSLPHLLLPRL